MNRKIFSDLIKCYLSIEVKDDSEVLQLTVDEEKCSWICSIKLLKKYKGSSSCSLADALAVIECLSSMAINGDESDLLVYTTKWTLLVNRGLI